jgi:nucleoside-diphosphate-sugar epimerase
MKILVTGGGGFLGTYIVRELLKQGHNVSSVSRNEYPHLSELGVKNLICDLTNKEDLDKLDLSSYEAVFHVAALAGVWGSYDKYYSINFEGTKNLIEKIKNQNTKYFIYTSSPSVVFGEDNIENGDESISYPTKFYTHYAKTKALAEKFVLESNEDFFKTTALRPHLIWGPGDPHLIPRIISKARENKLKQIGDGENLVDIIYVENAANAHVDAFNALVAEKSVSGKAYFIGQERPVKIWQFIDDIVALKNIKPIESMISFKKAFYIGWFLEIMFKVLGILKPEPPMTRFVALQLAKSHYFSHANAIRDFGFNPKITIEEGLKRTFSEVEISKEEWKP